MLARIRFASSFAYSPQGRGSAAQDSRLLCGAIKRADGRWLARYACRVRQMLTEHPALAAILEPHALLVPVPGRRPLPRSRSVTDCLTQALLEHGVGGGTWRGLQRIEAVPKSATSPPLLRPSVAVHYRSFGIADIAAVAALHAAAPLRLVLIDDVVTKGRTLLAAASRLHDALPTADISAFALQRTLGRTDDIEALLAPCCGEIRWLRGDACREP